MRIRFVTGTFVGAAFFFITTASAAAQNSPKADLSVGYQFTHLNGSDGADGTNIPAGWTASVASRLSPIVSVAGEINGAYKDGARLHNVLGGLKFGGGPSGATNAVVISGQILAGLAKAGNTNGLAIQPGVVVDVRGEGNISTRFNVDYNITRANGTTHTGFRIAAGVVLTLGH